eukprot:TRINITY_DN2231_c0_g1_i1.p1 TRINITY_DN2231_c0_g1~~TRINITY_DN2231_c0_g1_i1.p1  ORF type:complete len:384 (-),score=55.67 TRINITY_DN2231_c0_g1_i1:25-1176(-)
MIKRRAKYTVLSNTLFTSKPVTSKPRAFVTYITVPSPLQTNMLTTSLKTNQSLYLSPLAVNYSPTVFPSSTIPHTTSSVLSGTPIQTQNNIEDLQMKFVGLDLSSTCIPAALEPITFFEEKRQRFEFLTGSHVVPHPEKLEKGGEDAFFTCSNSLGISDGVGGWQAYGIDPALYSKSFMAECDAYIKDSTKSKTKIDPLEVLQYAEQKCQDITGSATALVAHLSKENILEIRNIGDSRCMILRYEDDKYIGHFFTFEQQHRFNLPFQLGTKGDNPEDSDLYVQELKENDLVILGTDGLFDNLFLAQIINIVNNNLEQIQIGDLNTVSTELANRAYLISINDQAVTPWIVQARSNGLDYIGGKSDDITVVVAKVVKKSKKLNVN